MEDYHKEMEVAMIWTNIEKDYETTMERFLVGLNWEIAHIVELQHYVELTDMVHMGIKVERKLKEKGSFKAENTSGSTSTWSQSVNKKVVVPQVKCKINMSKDNKQEFVSDKNKIEVQPS